MNNKESLLKPRLLESLERFRTFIDLNAPNTIIGAELASLFRVTLATYGASAGLPLLSDLMDREYHSRAICGNEDCVNRVDRPDVGICEPCKKELGLDDETIDKEIAGWSAPDPSAHLGHRGTE